MEQTENKLGGWLADDGEFHQHLEMDTIISLYDFNRNIVAHSDDHDMGVWGPVAGAGGAFAWHPCRHGELWPT